MSTFAQNLAKIRGEAIYGMDMREAIAEALEQADDIIVEKLQNMQTLVDTEAVYGELTLIAGTTGDYLLTLSGNL